MKILKLTTTLFSLLLFYALINPVNAQGNNSVRVWTGILHATRQNQPNIDKKQLGEVLANVLRKNFPSFNSFDLIGNQSKNLSPMQESTLFPTKQFFFKIRPKGSVFRPNGANIGERADLQLWHGDKPILNTDAVLTRKRPIIIKGPNYGNGVILFVVKLR